MTVLQDIRYGARLMIRKPAFSAISVLTLSLGIGLTAMMFSIVNGALLKGLPFDQADRLVDITRNNPSQGNEQMGVTLHDLEEWREQQQAFEGLASFTTGTFNVSGQEGAERYDGAWISANTFDLLRTAPILGRNFRAGEDAPGAELVSIISYRVWQDRFGGDSGVLGQTLRINGEEATIVGVMGERFLFPDNQVIWLPERRSAVQFSRGAPNLNSVSVLGRLRPGVSLDQANVQMSAIARQLAERHPETNEGIGAAARPFIERAIGTEAKALLFTMLGAVFGVLLIACFNVANLLLSQAALRAKEVGIRTALGASRIRIILQFLTEPLVLAVVGAILGLGLAWIGVALFTAAIASTNPPFWLDFSIDGTVLFFVLGLTLFTTIVAGLLPAVRASGSNVNEILKDDSRGASSFRGGRMTKVLVICEVSLSVVLLFSAGLMIKSITKLGAIEYGFATDDVFTARFGLPEADAKYADVSRRIHFFEEVEARIAADPGVRGATIMSALPGLGSNGNRMSIEGESYDRPNDHPTTRVVVATPSYFETFGAGLLQGRPFSAADRGESLPVTIVNQSFSRKFFPDGDAVGRRVQLGGADSEAPWLTIVGIAPDMYLSGVEDEQPAGIYTPLAQSSDIRFASIAARTVGSPMALTPRVREAIALVDADIPIYWVFSLDASIAQSNWFFRVFGGLFMIMGFVALFLAAIGLYGVMSFSVSRRTREMGVRMALGARGGDVQRLILRQGFGQLAIGVGIGLVGAYAGAQLLTNMLFGVSPRDPGTFVAIVIVLGTTGLLASWVPARRATRVDPVVALRNE